MVVGLVNDSVVDGQRSVDLALVQYRWLIKNHLKHGCMTLPGLDKPAPGLGHRSPEPEAAAQPSTGPESGMAMHGHGPHGGEAHEEHGMTMHELPFAVATAWVLASFVFLVIAILVTDRFVPVQF